MKYFSNMSTDRFIEELRSGAIASKQPPLVIDLIDRLLELKDEDSLDEACSASFEEGQKEAADSIGRDLVDVVSAIDRALDVLDAYLDESVEVSDGELREVIRGLQDARKLADSL